MNYATNSLIMSAETPRRPCCFITGAAGGGIGTSTAVKFAQHGYDIVAGDIADTAGVKALVEAEGVICLGLRMDVCNKNSVDNGEFCVACHWLSVLNVL